MGRILTDIESAKRSLTVSLILLITFFTLFEYFRTARWGQALRGEWNLWTISEAMLDFTVGIIAFGCAMLGRYIDQRIRRDRSWIAWLLISVAFVYFTFDETLQFHERVGQVMRRLGIAEHLYGMRPHNVFEATYYLGAIILTLVILRYLRRNRAVFAFYMGGIAAMAMQTALGLLPRPIAYDRMPFMFAEVLEEVALTCFACSFLVLAFDKLGEIAGWVVRDRSERDSAEQVLSHQSVGN